MAYLYSQESYLSEPITALELRGESSEEIEKAHSSLVSLALGAYQIGVDNVSPSTVENIAAAQPDNLPGEDISLIVPKKLLSGLRYETRKEALISAAIEGHIDTDQLIKELGILSSSSPDILWGHGEVVITKEGYFAFPLEDRTGFGDCVDEFTLSELMDYYPKEIVEEEIGALVEQFNLDRYVFQTELIDCHGQPKLLSRNTAMTVGKEMGDGKFEPVVTALDPDQLAENHPVLLKAEAAGLR